MEWARPKNNCLGKRLRSQWQLLIFQRAKIQTKFHRNYQEVRPIHHSLFKRTVNYSKWVCQNDRTRLNIGQRLYVNERDLLYVNEFAIFNDVVITIKDHICIKMEPTRINANIELKKPHRRMTTNRL